MMASKGLSTAAQMGLLRGWMGELGIADQNSPLLGGSVYLSVGRTTKA